MITIIDYGLGNLGSIKNMLRRVGASCEITSDVETILKAQKIILPGVGSFDSALTNIAAIRGLKEVLNQKALQDKIPVLGVCLGMQLLTRSSEEGNLPGFGWIPADTKRFPSNLGLKIPHMGWNTVKQSTPSVLTQGLDSEFRFYFVHSYCVTVDHPSHSILKTTYGISFDSAIQNGNIYGAQFHPEKSHRFGMVLLKNFSEL